MSPDRVMIDIAYQQETAKTILAIYRKFMSEDGTQPRVCVFQMDPGMGKTYTGSLVMKGMKDGHTFFFTPNSGGLAASATNELRQFLGGDVVVKHISELTESDFGHTGPLPGHATTIQWEVVTTGAKDDSKRKSKLTNEDAEVANFWDFIEKASILRNPAATRINIIIDESHHGKQGSFSAIQAFLAKVTRILGYYPFTLEMSATPVITKMNGRAPEHVHVPVEEGRAAQLIRKAPVLNLGLKGYIKSLGTKRYERETRITLLERALETRDELEERYLALDPDHTLRYGAPLIGIQVSDAKEGNDRIAEVLEFLESKGYTVENGKVAVYLSGGKTDAIAGINDPSSPIRVLIYKQAVQTGWNCPRAQVHVGFRDIKSKVFSKQGRGRYYRTVGAKYYSDDFLNHAYIFTEIESIEEGFEEDGSADDMSSWLSDSSFFVARDERFAEVKDANMISSAFKRADRNPVNAEKLRDVIVKNWAILSKLQSVDPNQFTKSLIGETRFEDNDGALKVVSSEGTIDGFARFMDVPDLTKKIFQIINASDFEFGADNRLAEMIARRLVLTKSKEKAFLAPYIEALKDTNSIARYGVTIPAYVASQFFLGGNSVLLERFVLAVLSDPEMPESKKTAAEEDEKTGARETRCWKFTGSWLPPREVEVPVKKRGDEVISEVIPEDVLSYGLYETNEYASALYDQRTPYYAKPLSNPERMFQEFLMGLHKDGKVEDLWFQKNGEGVDDFQIGVRNGDFVTGFLPDYYGVIQVGGVRKFFVFEVKSKKPHAQDSTAGVTLAKATALRTYMEHTGIIAGVVYPLADGEVWNVLGDIRGDQATGKDFQKFVTENSPVASDDLPHVPYTRTEVLDVEPEFWDWFGGDFGTPTKENVKDARARYLADHKRR